MGRFLATVLRRPPAVSWQPQLQELLAELPMEPANPEMAQGAGLLADYARQAHERAPAAEADLLRQDFMALFEGPGPMSAPPWESVYRCEEQVLFGPCTLDVRQAYRRWGLGLPEPGREPEDHIALELEFLLFLTERGSDPGAAAERTRFLREHLLAWIRPFCDLLEHGANTLFYQGMARLLLGYVLAESMIP